MNDEYVRKYKEDFFIYLLKENCVKQKQKHYFYILTCRGKIYNNSTSDVIGRMELYCFQGTIVYIKCYSIQSQL